MTSLFIILILLIAYTVMWSDMRAAKKKQEAEYIRGWDRCRTIAMERAKKCGYNVIKIRNELFGGEE